MPATTESLRAMWNAWKPWAYPYSHVGICEMCGEIDGHGMVDEGDPKERPCLVGAFASALERLEAAEASLLQEQEDHADTLEQLADAHIRARCCDLWHHTALEDVKIMATADRMTLGDGRDFSLAAYMVRDLPMTKTANLYELADAMSEGNASRGDWDGLREHWWSAWLAALAQEQPGAGTSSHPEGVAAVCICVATPGGLVYRLGCPFLNKDGTHE